LIGQIKEVSRHQNADRLYLAVVDVGQTEMRSIIFGGTRILEPGDLVPVALPGIRLSSGEKVRSRKYRGVRSYGEILSSNELGWTVDGPDEVLVLSADEFKVGDIIRQS